MILERTIWQNFKIKLGVQKNLLFIHFCSPSIMLLLRRQPGKKLMQWVAVKGDSSKTYFGTKSIALYSLFGMTESCFRKKLQTMQSTRLHWQKRNLTLQNMGGVHILLLWQQEGSHLLVGSTFRFWISHFSLWLTPASPGNLIHVRVMGDSVGDKKTKWHASNRWHKL